MGSLQRQSDSSKRPQTTLPDLLSRLAAAGVPRFAAEARRHLPAPTDASVGMIRAR